MNSFHSFILFVLLTGSNGSNQKRILVDDIDIHQLQADMQAMKAEIQPMKSKILHLEHLIQHLTSSVVVGAVYTRWGRKDCPGNKTTLIYTGFAAGGNYNNYGAAAEYVCLPDNPEFNMGEKAQPPYGYNSYIYGAEYEDNVFGKDFSNKDVPCAVCLSNAAFNVIMIPGKSTCVSGWSKEYSGRLASQSSSLLAAGQYVCVDINAEPLDDLNEDEAGKLFYPVHAACGSLRCPPYINNELLTCVVCSK